MIENLPQYLDYANHHAAATQADIEKLCASVLEHGFHAAFVNACYISLAKKLLAGNAPLGTVISFPLGQDTTALKVAAVNDAVALGADELDIVPNIGMFLSGDTNAFLAEMKTIADAARIAGLAYRESGKPVVVKFILDPGYITTAEQMKQAATAIQQSGADFVKIGSGMGPRNPTVTDFTIVRAAVGPDMKIKVAGGITTYEEAKVFIDAGASRIGTSHAVEIVTQSSTVQ
jgi:deoxyribose-phosphate aldolase